MMLPTSLGDEQHGQDDQGKLAHQSGVVAPGRLRPAEPGEQADQAEREPLDQQADLPRGPGDEVDVEVDVVPAFAGRAVGQQPGQHADHRLVDLLRAPLPLVEERAHDVPPPGRQALAVEPRPDHDPRDDDQEERHPQERRPHRPPRALVEEVGHEQRRRDLVGDRQRARMSPASTSYPGGQASRHATIKKRMSKLLLP